MTLDEVRCENYEREFSLNNEQYDKIESIESFENETSELFLHLDDLIRTEKVYKFNYDHQKTAFLLRGHVIEWLFILNKQLQFENLTFFKTVSLFDLFLSKEKEIVVDKNNIQLFAAVCFFISAKIEEVSFFNEEFLQNQILKEKFELDLIIQTEIQILKKVNFKLHFITLHHFSEAFNEIIKNILHHDFELLNLKKIELISNMNFFVNMMSLYIDELIFSTNLNLLYAINLKTSLLFLQKENKLNNSEKEKIEDLINFSFNFTKIEVKKISETSSDLLDAIVNKITSCKKKTYQKVYEEILN